MSDHVALEEEQYRQQQVVFQRVIEHMHAGGLISSRTVEMYTTLSSTLAISPEVYAKMTAHLDQTEKVHLLALSELAPKIPASFF